jgi:arginyl-tRNA synthetase
MIPICDILEERACAAMARVADRSSGEVAAIVKPSQNPKFGDYQANGVMGLAKQLKTNPRQLAEQIVEKLDVADICESPEIAGPGFINFRLKPDWLAARLAESIEDPDRLGVDPMVDPPVTVVDFSSPNIAKQMHVGHLRSTIIGDVIARILEFCYADPKKVIRQNHVGDWGTQFGMLITMLRERASSGSGEIENNLSDLEAFYKAAKSKFDSDSDFQKRAYQAVVDLQNGDPDTLNAWQSIVDKSLAYCDSIYKHLNVKLTSDDVRGESYYNDNLHSVISALSKVNLLTESDGAQCVFLDGFKSKEGEPLPLIVQKSDGAYLYATTDLAAIRFRTDELKANRVIYVTDARQKLHFEMVFACARQAGWADNDVLLEHVPFGSVLGEDGKPFKTRSGENVKLTDLLDEAVQRARKVVEEKNPDLDESEKQDIARAVGIGAVKYADLSNHLVSDYVFNWDRMLAMEGNTAPYMQYAYARVQSIFRKGNVSADNLSPGSVEISLYADEESTLAKLLLRYSEVIETVCHDLRPHLLTNYLFELAKAFSAFHQNCHVLNSDEPLRSSRLLLCLQTGRTIRHGLSLLGIDTPGKM